MYYKLHYQIKSHMVLNYNSKIKFLIQLLRGRDTQSETYAMAERMRLEIMCFRDP